MIPAIDTIIEASLDAQGAGIAVAVAQDDQTLHSKGYGFANLEWSNPITSDTVFRLASVTKPFTATAILLLEKQGKLHITDHITSYLPDSPPHWQPITIEHLLTHTAGLKNYLDIDGFYKNYAHARLTPAELSALFSPLPLAFAPGTQFAYCNSGYILLGRIIEGVSGLPYEQFMHTHILTPLDMPHTYYMHDEAVIPRRATGYVKTERGFQHAPFRSVTASYASGGLGSTLNDLLTWGEALHTHRILDAQTLARALTPVILPNGQNTDYGLGWSVEQKWGQRISYHQGGSEGFSTFLMRFLDRPVTLVLLANVSGYDVVETAMKIGALLVA